MNKAKKGKFKLLDCTIRDGGYLNNWQFESKVVREVYRSLSDAGVDIVELGFKSSSKYFDRKEYGPWRFCDEEDLKEVTRGISGAKIGAMVDFGKVDIEDIDEKNNSIIEIIRVAVHKNKIKDALRLIEKINAKGYETSIQMMGFSTFSKSEQKKVISLLKNSNVDYAYVADSYGSILPFQIKERIKPLIELSNKKIGFHPHNNLQMGFANSLEAIDCGIDILDGSIYGMGRGAGNLTIETMVAYLQLQGIEKYNVIPILHVIDRYFVDYQKEMKWGHSLPYMLSGMFGCHPYYAKTLIDKREYTIEDIWKALEAVQILQPIGFSKDIVEKIINYGLIGKLKTTGKKATVAVKYVECTPGYINRHKGQDFLILGNGPNLKKYKDQIAIFIEKYNPVVMGANYLGGLFVPDYHAFNNKRRFIDYAETVDPRSKLLIGQNITDDMINKYTSKKYETLCYKNILHEDFNIKNGVIQTNCQTVSVLLMGVAIVMGAKRIFSAGLDGYVDTGSINKTHYYQEKDRPEDFDFFIETHQWNEHFLNQINDYLINKHMEGIHILSPTSYKKFYKDIKNYI